jgi:hypothetical protein
MNLKFDIFTRLPDRTPLWVKAVDGLEEAENCLSQLAETSGEEGFIYSERSGRFIDHVPISRKDRAV